MAHHRVQQWATFARQWWVYDATWQCPFRSAPAIIKHLQGKHKPIYHPTNDCGDHVVVINSKHIAMEGDLWRTFKYSHHTGGKDSEDPDLETFSENVPDEILKNLSGQIQQVMTVPKGIHEYTEEEKAEFPALFDWPQDHIMMRSGPSKPKQ
ncbi:hypothetical protein LSH36_123g02006 [Paralvinella palmiformis]|uniref:39S ribosomal protein L13, mitochondrial n=1 Tax=Paralvinella palmiformis TaxID=53620 RepID=A0AAD9JX57_9ANNE|nr:hypothetical protein LSH36_123g02006 [Paralvinella palmiformis]